MRWYLCPQNLWIEDNLGIPVAAALREQTKPLAGGQGSCAKFPIESNKTTN